MNKKIMIEGILAVFMLLAISLTTTVSSNAIDVEKKESPLWIIKSKKAVTEKIGRVIDNVKASFIGENRICFVSPFYRLFPRDENILTSVMLVPSFCFKC